ncbi:hypothetical protein PTQ19_10240 [Microbacterium esteraromaticum]|uniref:hypothetical protein n=1 Tax=Microbacterium esteraromaticum TaxID=57043 RepID=UPI00236882FA|nr:hypothetical protein [Microbacterium esteraromaticum]WDH77900.1 hypothetical protein PTQ19_10240 [Microbacterium esteraromaticum]
MRLSEYVLQVINDPKYGHDIEWVKGNLHRAHIEEIEAAHTAEKRAEWEAEHETDWEYGILDARGGRAISVGAPWMNREYAQRVTANDSGSYGVRRRKAGVWLPVPDCGTPESED